MPIRIPQNKIQYNYTSGKEYMDETTYQEYQGYYYQLNGKIFAGKEFNSNAPVLIPIPKDKSNLPFNFNKLLTQAATYTYGRISGNKIQNIKVVSLPLINDPNIDTTDVENITNTYYTKKVNSTTIKQIDEETFQNIKINPLYTTVSIKPDYSNIDDAEKQMPGIKAFLDFL